MNKQPELDSHWNYRVIRKENEHKGTKWITFGIHEVYYSDGKPSMCSENARSPHGETFEDLTLDLEWYQLALTKPTLNYEDLSDETTDTETTT